MADNCDTAQTLTEHRLALALAAHARRTAAAPNDCTECSDCGEAIPTARRRALPHASRCVECQGLAEMKMRGGR